jgi:hypothetical protein
MKCSGSVFQVAITEVEKAATKALKDVAKRRQDAFEVLIKSSMKRSFFKDRTYDEARTFVLNCNVDSNMYDWQIIGWGTENTANKLLSAIKVVSGTEFVLLSTDHANFVNKWVNKK